MMWPLFDPGCERRSRGAACLQLLEVLMNSGAKLNVRNHEGKTPIAVACNAPTRRAISSQARVRSIPRPTAEQTRSLARGDSPDSPLNRLHDVYNSGGCCTTFLI